MPVVDDTLNNCSALGIYVLVKGHEKQLFIGKEQVMQIRLKVQ